MKPRYLTDPFCNMPHPDYVELEQVNLPNGTKCMVDRPTVWCRRIKGHDGDHSAIISLANVSQPESWPA